MGKYFRSINNVAMVRVGLGMTWFRNAMPHGEVVVCIVGDLQGYINLRWVLEGGIFYAQAVIELKV